MDLHEDHSSIHPFAPIFEFAITSLNQKDRKNPVKKVMDHYPLTADGLSMVEYMTANQVKEELRERGIKPPALLVGKLREYLAAARLPTFRAEIPPQPGLYYYPVQAPPNAGMDFLAAHGWTVFDIPDFDSNRYISAIQEWLSTFCPLRLDNPATWTKANEPYNLHGILKHYVGHEAFLWEIREKCIPIFSALHGTTDLLSSFDGINVSWPRGDAKNNLHCDMMRDDMGCPIYQGVVNLVENGGDNGGLCLVDGSHLKLAEYYIRHPEAGLSWGKVDYTDPAFSSLPIYKICLKPGQIAIWDSRVVHCAVQPTSGLRLAAYVCMRPKAGCSPTDMMKRIRGYESGKMSNHVCYGANFDFESVQPWVHGLPKNPRPEVIRIAGLNARQCGLVGYPPSVTGTPPGLMGLQTGMKPSEPLPGPYPVTDAPAAAVEPATVVHLKIKDGVIVQGCSTYIGRRIHMGGWNLPDSIWGNPFKLTEETDRSAVLAAYENYIRSSPQLLAQLPTLKGHTLGCWCKPLSCHGDVLVKLMKEFGL